MKLYLLYYIYLVTEKIASWAGRNYEEEQERKFELPPNYHVNLVAKAMVENLDNYPLARAILVEAAFRGVNGLNPEG